LAFTAVIALLFMPFLDYFDIEKVVFVFNSDVIIALVYTTIFATLFNITMMTKYQKEVVPVKAAIIYSFEPIFAAVFAFIMIGESFTRMGLVGAAIIFSGLVFTEIFKKEELNGD
jgi:drug/metabolite transporter (DMT)-like permease